MRKLAFLTWTIVLAAGCTAAPTSTPPGTTSPPADSTVAAAGGESRAPTPSTVSTTTTTATAPIALSLELDPVPVQQGGQLQVSGRGFAAGEAVNISASKAEPGSDLMQLADATATTSGTIDSVQITLPDDLKSGPHAIQAVGATSGRQNNGTLWVRAPEPWVVLGAYDVQQYGDLGFVGGGFEPMEQVNVSLQPAQGSTGTTTQLTTFETDQAGNGEWTQVKLPAMRAGAYSFVMQGQAGGQELRRDMQVKLLTPTVELSPWAGPPGMPVQVNARGFAPNERVSFSMGDDTRQAGELQADEYGNLWGAGPVRMPQSAAAGPLKINLLGEESGAHASPEFKVLETKPWLELTSWWGAPGSPVSFGGGGWIANEHVTFHIGNAGGPAQGDMQADDGGWLRPSGVAYVPFDAVQDITFVAVGAVSGKSATATFKVVFPFGLRPDGSEAPAPGP